MAWELLSLNLLSKSTAKALAPTKDLVRDLIPMAINPKCTYLLFVLRSCRPVCSKINLIISCLPSG